ncbi:MAG: histidinol-phosphate transaminase [Planctomycetota bacterium]
MAKKRKRAGPRPRRSVAKMAAYVPGEQPKPSELRRLVKLNTNESPYPPSKKVAAAVKRAASRLRVYPDPGQSRLRELAGKVYGFRPERVLGGNGSDELLALIGRAFVPERGTIMTMRPTYLVYETVAAGLGARLVEVSFTREYGLPAGLAKRRADVFFLANPNSPTGTAVWPDEVEAFAKKFRGLVVVDEAYADFSRFNCLALARKMPNVMVLRTMSKSFSLAGLRLGLALGPGDVIAALTKLKDSYNLSGLQLAAAEAALRDMGHVRRNVRRIVTVRAKLTRELVARGFLVLPSESNFVMFHLGKRLSKKLGAGPGAVKALRRKGVLVRHYPGAGLRDALRVTVGTEKQIDRFLKALDAVTS